MINNIIKTTKISGARLQVGFLLLLVWCLPMELLAPVIAEMTRLSLERKVELTGILIVVIIIIQTTNGLIGLFLVGHTSAKIIKSTPKHKLISALWKTLITGTYTPYKKIDKKTNNI